MGPLKGIYKEHEDLFSKFSKFSFSKTLSLDARTGSWDLKNRIPRRKLCIQSYSQVETRQSKSKYLKIDVKITGTSKTGHWKATRHFFDNNKQGTSYTGAT